MQKRSFDLAIGLGMACSCSQTLREAGLQYMSFPYDWVTLTDNTETAYAGDFSKRAKELADGFSSWFRKDDFQYTPSALANGMDSYRCARLGLLFQHDFYSGIPYEESFPTVLAKYRRRIDRLMSYLRTAKRVLILRIDRPDLPFQTPTDDLIRAAEDRRQFNRERRLNRYRKVGAANWFDYQLKRLKQQFLGQKQHQKQQANVK